MRCEWKDVRVKDVISFVVDNRGKTPPTQENGHNLLEVNTVSATEKYPQYKSVRKHVSTTVYDTWFRSGHPQIGDILVPTVGTLGAVSCMNRDDCCIAQNLIALRPNPDICTSDFLYYSLCNPNIRKRLLNLNIGGVQPSIKVPHLLNMEIEIPDLKTQERIANILSTLDSKIELNQRINENLERQARTIYHKWLADNSGKFELHLLSEIAIINPDTYSPKESWEYFNYLDTSSITNGDISEIQHFTQTEKLPSRARRKVINGDIVFSTVRPNQKHFGLIFSALPNMLVSTGFAVIRSTLKRVCNELIYLQITEDAFIEKMQQLAEQSTSTFPSIKPSNLGDYLISCPSEQDGLELSKQLKAIFTLAAIKREENEKLSALRDTLLPKFMTRELDVSNIRL